MHMCPAKSALPQLLDEEAPLCDTGLTEQEKQDRKKNCATDICGASSHISAPKSMRNFRNARGAQILSTSRSRSELRKTEKL